ncbi:YcnI family copper-binding membrane protein [Jatrophihabitans sp. YIM 134969]
MPLRPAAPRRRHVALAGVAAALVFAAGTVPAWAHVSVSAPDATQGGYGVVTFRVPNESADASTVGITVRLPTDTPLGYVAVQPTPGWTFTAPEATLPKPITTDDGQVTKAVTEITWTATDGGVKPGEFMQFDVQMGPFPDEDSLTFKAIQKYSDGSEVDWIEEAAAGSTAEPEHPAPVLALAPASGATGATDTSAAASAPATATVTAVADRDAASRGSATTGIVLGIVGVLLGAAALVVALRRGRPHAG